MVPWWSLLILGILAIIAGLIIGFFVAKKWFEGYVKKNPPINEKMIKTLYRQLGRTPNEAQVRQVLNSVNPHATFSKKK